MYDKLLVNVYKIQYSKFISFFNPIRFTRQSQLHEELKEFHLLTMCPLCLQAIYNMVGNEMKGAPDEQPEERTDKIFAQMDKNNDGVLTKQEFIDGCLADDFLCQMLTANTAGGGGAQ